MQQTLAERPRELTGAEIASVFGGYTYDEAYTQAMGFIGALNEEQTIVFNPNGMESGLNYYQYDGGSGDYGFAVARDEWGGYHVSVYYRWGNSSS